jgi:putative membrane protein
MITLEDLPLVNAILNGISSVFLLLGFLMIREKRIGAHRRFMVFAFATSILFLASYVLYHANIGSKPYQGTGVMRIIYFSILIPHVILAAAVPPLAIVTLWRGLRMDVLQHRKIAKITFPIWMFVSVTGVLVYLMLYRF